ncbi:MAG: carboxymethylenebutenolidase [Thiotrichales bacterium]|nr:carboxymethylenebutenolidase [Thiotrichales bacterium]
MGHMADVKMEDGVTLRVYRADPQGTPRAGMVVMQEAFGMNSHIRDMCDRYAAEGYLTFAPALYDRVDYGTEVPGYAEEDLAKALELRKGMDWEQTISDMHVVIGLAREAGPVGVVGYCWGGSLAWLAATRCGVDSAVSYYGGQIVQFIDETPGCPFMAHFADHDVHVPPESAAVVAEHHPGVPVYRYDANHGFNCDQRSDYDAASAKLAQERTSEFFAANLQAAPAAAAGE